MGMMREANASALVVDSGTKLLKSPAIQSSMPVSPKSKFIGLYHLVYRWKNKDPDHQQRKCNLQYSIELDV